MAVDSRTLVKYETEQGEVTLSPQIIRRYLVSGDADKVTDQEVMMFLALCKYQRLNPFLREAYLIKFGNNPATIVTGKETFTKRAANNQICKGWEAGIILQTEKGIEQRMGTFMTPDEKLVGGWARIHREDWTVPLEITVSLSEYQRYTKQGELMRNWKEMPATMIRKVALVQALREAMPQEFQGMYSPEEMPIDVSALSQEPVQMPKQETPQEEEQSSQSKKTQQNNDDLERTRKALFAKAKELGYSNDEIKDFLVAKFNTESTKNLTKAQIIEFIKFLETQKTEEYSEEDAAFAQGEL